MKMQEAFNLAYGTNGIALIARERERQQRPTDRGGEGFTVERDLEHYTRDELALAAIHYAAPDGMMVWRGDAIPTEGEELRLTSAWPKTWDKAWDKKGHGTRLQDLVKAGALIAAEIDRHMAELDGYVEELTTAPPVYTAEELTASPPVLETTAPLTEEALSDAYRLVEKKDISVALVRMNSKHWPPRGASGFQADEPTIWGATLTLDEGLHPEWVELYSDDGLLQARIKVDQP